jgi:signal transduction histidine kinase
MRRMTIARKSVLIVAIPLLFEAVFLTVYFDSERQSAEHRLRQSHSTEMALSVGRLLGLSNDAQSVLRAYAITGDPALLHRFQRSLAKLPGEFRELQRLASVDPDGEVRDIPRKYEVSGVAAATGLAIGHLQEESALLAAGRQDAVIEHLKGDATSSVLDDFRRTARGYQAEELAEQQHEYLALERLAIVRQLRTVAMIAGNSILALVLFWWLHQYVSRRAQVVLDNMSRYAEGEDVHRIEQRPDEIGMLDAQFHRMAEQLDSARALLESRNDELARMNVEKNHFMGMAAHDLRNPLFGASVMIDALLRRKEMPEREQGMLRRVQAALKAMVNLVSDFLDVSLIESGELRLRLSLADATAIARECVEMAQLQAEQKQIELRCQVPPEPVVASIDQEKIGQVISNFLSNAVKYSPAGGRIDVFVAQCDGVARISVADQGPGIAPEELARLFKPFSRASTKPTAGESSTGLGLAICRKIVEGHGGRVWAESDVGQGSVFSFEVPLAR